MPTSDHQPLAVCEFEYREFPPALEKIVRRHMKQVAWMVPRWCRWVYVKYDTSEAGGVAASIIVNAEYRHALLDICPFFFSTKHTDADRTQMLAHELIHVSVNQIVDYANAEIKRILPDSPTLKASLEEGMRFRVECVTQDLSIMLTDRGRLPKKGKR